MDRARFLEWARDQLRFFGQIDARCHLAITADESGEICVSVETKDDALRAEWAEIFRETQAGHPPHPPGPTPEGAGPLELGTSAGGESALEFRWMHLGSHFLGELARVTGALVWLIQINQAHEIPEHGLELDLDTVEEFEIER